MAKTAVQRLASRLRNIFPAARIELVGHALVKLTFEDDAIREIEISTRPPLAKIAEIKPHHQMFESKLTLQYECLDFIPDSEFYRLITAENAGLRGATVASHVGPDGKRALTIKTAFLGGSGKSLDETENAVVDIQSLALFTRLLEDRILRSTVNGVFCYEMYRSQYVTNGRGRNRYINYARQVFNGDPEAVFSQAMSLLKDDYNCEILLTESTVARVKTPSLGSELVMQIPAEAPILTCYAPLLYCDENSIQQSLKWVGKLNEATQHGHFELSPDGRSISFVAWKQLTNDVQIYSIDQMILSVYHAERLLTDMRNSKSGAAHHLRRLA